MCGLIYMLEFWGETTLLPQGTHLILIALANIAPACRVDAAKKQPAIGLEPMTYGLQNRCSTN